MVQSSPPPLMDYSSSSSPSLFSSANATTTTMSSWVANPVATSMLDIPEVDSSNCRLMGPFALFVQAVMGILVIASLIYKRHRERPKRKWKVWILDITKQMLGQLLVHTLNVIFSVFSAHEGGDNPCSLYFLNILIDTTLGVFFIYITLRFVTHIMTDVFGLNGFVSGQYNDHPEVVFADSQGGLPTTNAASTGTTRATSRRRSSPRPKLSYWLRQLATYLFVLFLMKLIVLLILALFPFLVDLGAWILGLFGSHKHVQVLFSMALFPFAMNVVQFWLIDSLLRHNPYTSIYSKIQRDSEEIDHHDNGSAESSTSCLYPHPPYSSSSSNSYCDAGIDSNPDKMNHSSKQRQTLIGSDSFHRLGTASDDEVDENDPFSSNPNQGNKEQQQQPTARRRAAGSFTVSDDDHHHHHHSSTTTDDGQVQQRTNQHMYPPPKSRDSSPTSRQRLGQPSLSSSTTTTSETK